MQQVVIAGRYRLLDLVGRGGMGRVWRARDDVLHRDVAVKQVVPPAWLSDEERDELRLRTLREGRTAARLNHPNVVRVYDVVSVGGDPWLIMEYVPSRSLQNVLDTSGPVSPRQAAAIGLALLAALRAAHHAGVLHRDVKPANVLIAHDGRVMLTDFGLAVFDGGDGAMTRPGLILGSPQFVAPERAAEGSSSVEADLWSLGATLHASVEGRSPYARSTAMATLSALATRPPDPAPHAGPLRPVLAGLLCRDPRDRTDHDETQRRLASATTGGGEPCPLALAAPATVLPPDVLDPGAAPGAAPWPSTPVDHGRPAGSGPNGRRWPLAVAAGAFAALAAISTAIAIGQREHDRGAPPGIEAGRAGVAPDGTGAEPNRGAEPGAGLPGAGPPDRHVPPPPFPCLRPYPAGEPVPTVSPARGERLRLPAGWRWYADPTGFRLAVPPGWRHYREGDAVCFQDPTARRVLTIAPAGVPGAAPLARLRVNERRALDAGALHGYARIRLETVSSRGSEWEATWDAPYGARLHAVQLIPRDARAWSLSWSAPDVDWLTGATERDRVRVSFRPGTPG
ncbi:serine/threonine-protein kinase [Micromonospora sp. NPDC002296]|uniref:serine/threonine-protein kinase n=1 Tax=Micromonospora sp. NPDC002296 TaxID=3154271 RepID=UPI00332EF227